MAKVNQAAQWSGRAASDRAVVSAAPASVLVDRIVLLLLLALIPFRAIANETVTFEVSRLFRTVEIPGGAQPATTLFIAILIFFLALVHRAARLYFGGPAYRRTGMEVGLILLSLAAGISTWQAGQKHLALIGVLDFLAVIVYGLTLRQLLLRPWHIRLALIVILSTGAMIIAKCGLQHWVELPETLQYYEDHKAELQQGSGGEPGSRQSGLQHDYEQRLKAATVSGYYPHPNVLASHLILIIMTALALVSGRRSTAGSLWPQVVPLLIALAGMAALYRAQSQGAMGACGIAIVIWLVTHIWLKRATGLNKSYVAISEHPRAACLLFWLAAFFVGASFTTVLITKPDLFGRSMLFRTMYWRGAWEMIQDRGLLGVGANNFGRHFTRYKPVECPEEVESPHSWPVQLAAEWGGLGPVGFFTLLIGTSLVFAGGVSKRRASITSPPIATDDSGGSIILWQAGFALIVFGWWMGLFAGANPGFIALTIIELAIPWVIAFIALGFESASSRTISTSDLGPILPAICAGIIGFLIHTAVDLAMFHGAVTTTFFALVAIALATRDLQSCEEPAMVLPAPAVASRAGQPRLVAAALLTLAVIASGILTGAWVRPVALCSTDIEQGRISKQYATWAGYQTSPSFAAYVRANEGYKLDGTAAAELVEELIKRVASLEHTEFARHFLNDFRRRDPDNGLGLSHLGALYYQRYHFTKDLADFRKAIETFTESVAAYPTSPHRHIYLANMLEEYAAVAEDADARVRAAKELQTALLLEEKRVYVSQPNRLTDVQKAQISDRIARLNIKG